MAPTHMASCLASQGAWILCPFLTCRVSQGGQGQQRLGNSLVAVPGVCNLCGCRWLAGPSQAWIWAVTSKGGAGVLILGSSHPARPLQTRSSRHTQGAQPGLADQAAKLSYASAESLETMSEAELPLGFSRMNRFRQSLPLSRSASQTKLRSPGTARPVHPPSRHRLLPLLFTPWSPLLPYSTPARLKLCSLSHSPFSPSNPSSLHLSLALSIPTRPLSLQASSLPPASFSVPFFHPSLLSHLPSLTLSNLSLPQLTSPQFPPHLLCPHLHFLVQVPSTAWSPVGALRGWRAGLAPPPAA